MNNYKTLKVWQISRELTNEVYLITKKFPSEEKWNLLSQLRRSSISIISNIAEGCGRQTNRDFIRFLIISKGSSFELESQIIISKDLGYLTDNEEEKILSLIQKVQNMLHGLILSLENEERGNSKS
jgi:four helix bundle protein